VPAWFSATRKPWLITWLASRSGRKGFAKVAERRRTDDFSLVVSLRQPEDGHGDLHAAPAAATAKAPGQQRQPASAANVVRLEGKCSNAAARLIRELDPILQG
jgi:hypothetical protein